MSFNNGSCSYEIAFLKALFTTVILELGVVFLLCRWLYTGFSKSHIFGAGILPSTMTLPYVWFVLPAFLNEYHVYGIASEVFAVVTETLLIAMILRTGVKTGLVLSLVANTVSFLIGLLLVDFGFFS